MNMFTAYKKRLSGSRFQSLPESPLATSDIPKLAEIPHAALGIFRHEEEIILRR